MDESNTTAGPLDRSKIPDLLERADAARQALPGIEERITAAEAQGESEDVDDALMGLWDPLRDIRRARRALQREVSELQRAENRAMRLVTEPEDREPAAS